MEQRPWLKNWPDDIPASIDYPCQPVWWLLQKQLQVAADQTAVRLIDHHTGEERTACTYAELWQKALSVAGALQATGLKPGDRAAICMPNSIELIAGYYGIWLAGGIVVPCDSMGTISEQRYQIRDSGASVLLCLRDQGGHFAQLGVPLLTDFGDHEGSPATVDPEDLAVLMYTGGTTGTPKGAMLSHRNLVSNTVQFGLWYGLQQGAERCISVLPLFHCGGMAGAMNVPLWAGAELLLMERFNPVVVARTIERYKATRFFGVPTMYVGVLEDEDACKSDFSSLRACRTSAASLPAAVKARFDELVGHEVLVEGYGLSEAGPLTHANPLKQPRAGAIGFPLPDTDARIVDEQGNDVTPGDQGQLLVRGPQVMQGYWRRPDETAAALAGGWLHTGDIARMDEDGYFSIVGRSKEVIISAGFKVWPREVEDVLYEHPGVELNAVVGEPDDYRGEVVKAFVVLKPDQRDEIDAEEIRRFVHERLAPYKVPRIVDFVDELPVSHQGKVLGRVLRGQSTSK